MRSVSIVLALALFVPPVAVLADDGAIQLTVGGDDSSPCWSPDGSRIGFSYYYSYAKQMHQYAEIWAVPSAGGTATQLTQAPYQWQYHDFPDWSPSGAHLAYSQLWGPPGWWIIVDGTYIAAGTQPSWSPDGNNIAFSDPGGNVSIVPATGGDVTPLTTGGGWAPDWSPYGDYITFTSSRSGNAEIWVIPATGGTATQITAEGGSDPNWSPDGKQIAFHSNRSGSSEIWVIPTTGGIATQITAEGGSDPYWSPAGTQITFVRNSGIWVIPYPPPIALNQESWGSIKGKYR
jgi:Tol biopolymer transport system component